MDILCADRLITGDGTTVLPNMAVAVSKDTGKIIEIGTPEKLEAKYKQKTVFYPGCSILPGLIDLHVHLSAWEKKPYGYAGSDFVHSFVTLRNARSAYAHGVTTMRSVADKNGLVASVVWASQNGLIEGPVPRIIPCGNGICMTGGHGSEFPDGGDIADGPWELRKRIRKNIQDGAQWIKLLTSKREFVPEFTQEELDAAVDECHRRNHKIAVHSGVPITIQMCIDAGVDTIEHGTFMSVEQARQMRDKKIAWVPTIMVYCESAKKAMSENSPDAESYNKSAQA
jgi:imidazolonepropionase-like amidohydrolase